MMDLHTRFENLGGPIEPASTDVIEADLARAHRALRRRRTVQMVTGSAFGVAAIVVAAAVRHLGAGDHGRDEPMSTSTLVSHGQRRLPDRLRPPAKVERPRRPAYCARAVAVGRASTGRPCGNVRRAGASGNFVDTADGY